MFTWNRPVPLVQITIEDTEKFLKEQMALISESKGGKSESRLPLSLSNHDEIAHAIADEIKRAQNERHERGDDIAVTNVTIENAKKMAQAIVSVNLKDYNESYKFLASLLAHSYVCFKGITDEEVKKEFMHHMAISLHQSCKKWVTNNKSWVEIYAYEADKLGVEGWIEKNRDWINEKKQNAKFYAAVGIVGVFGLFAAYQCFKDDGDVSAVMRKTLRM